MRKLEKNEDNTFKLKEVGIEELNLSGNIMLSIDGSSSCSGIGIFDVDNKSLLGCMALIRETEKAVKYKIEFKRFMTDILLKNKGISNIFYEEPFIHYINSSEVLIMMRSSIEEIICENEPDLDTVTYIEIGNRKWKKLWLAPDKIPAGGTDKEKEAVYNKLIGIFPSLNGITYDESDAISMGFTALHKLNTNSENELKSQGKKAKFAYDALYLGAESDTSFMCEFVIRFDEFKIPKRLLADDDMEIVQISSKGSFEDHVYKNMGDNDKLLVIKFKNNTHGNIILENRLGHLAQMYDWIYAVVWRRYKKIK